MWSCLKSSSALKFSGDLISDIVFIYPIHYLRCQTFKLLEFTIGQLECILDIFIIYWRVTKYSEVR